MKLEWMGRYRDIIAKIMRHGNLYARAYTVKLSDDSGIVLSSLEWQVLECILEHEEKQHNMTMLSKIVGVPQSNFSKYVKTLIDKKLVERYRIGNNQKDIILQVTDLGRRFYQVRSGIIAVEWQEVFDVLQDYTDEQLDQFSLFLEKLTESFDPQSAKPSQLKKFD